MLGISRLHRDNPGLWYEAHSSGWSWVAQMSESWLIPELTVRRFSDWFGAADEERLVEIPGVRVTRFWNSSKGKRFVIKTTRLPRFRTRLRAWLRPTHAEKEWYAARSAFDAGLPTPRPVAIGLFRDRGFVRETQFVRDALADCATVTYLLDRLDPSDRSFHTWLAPAAGRLLADLWRSGMHHGGLRPENLLVSGWPEEPRLWFIDVRQIENLGRTPTRQEIVGFLAFTHGLWNRHLRERKILPSEMQYIYRAAALSLRMETESLVNDVQALTCGGIAPRS